MQRVIVVLGVMAAVCLAAPQAAPQTNNFRRRIDPNRFLAARPQGNELLVDAQVGSLLRNAPPRSTLIAVQPEIPAILQRLPDNATLIRPLADLDDSFTCKGKSYGYYGDVKNDCQIFHVCLPLHQLYPQNFTTDVTYHFSFICNTHTRFSQDAMVCAWENEALPCAYSEELYWMNNNFFRMVPDESGFGERYAHINEKF